MSTCKCGLSSEYPECNGTHKITKNEKFRKALLQTMEDNKDLLNKMGSDYNQNGIPYWDHDIGGEG